MLEAHEVIGSIFVAILRLIHNLEHKCFLIGFGTLGPLEVSHETSVLFLLYLKLLYVSSFTLP